MLSQRTTASKTSELEALKEILDLLELRGSLISLDAGGCYQDVAAQVTEHEGDYLLAVKRNQPTLYEELDQLFEGDCERFAQHSESEYSHGRQEQRLAWVSHDPKQLPVAASWPGCTTVAMVQRICRVGEKETAEHRYYISSRKLDAEEVARRVRAHWQVENNLHWVLDMAFDEDRSRSRTGHSAANLVILRQ